VPLYNVWEGELSGKSTPYQPGDLPERVFRRSGGLFYEGNSRVLFSSEVLSVCDFFIHARAAQRTLCNTHYSRLFPFFF
jgi:hypothetical protein